MSAEPMNGSRRHDASSTEDPVEVGRYLQALKRNLPLILAIVVVLTGVVLALSIVLPKKYDASTSIVVSEASSTAAVDDATVQRDLATASTLVTTDAVLGGAARSVPGETADGLRPHVTATVDQTANIIGIGVSYEDPQQAATLANAVARSFIASQSSTARVQIRQSQAALDQQLQALSAQGDSGTAQQRVRALQDRLAQLTVDYAAAGSGYRIAQAATAPDGASSPQPVRNALIALFASVFLAVLVALARDQLSPRISSQRELGRLLGLPVLGTIPRVSLRNRARKAAAEYETYQALAASLRLTLSPGRQHVVLVTSAVSGEGKTSVAVRLGRLLAQAGHRTLVVSGDLRRPRLDDVFGVSDKPGLSDVLAGLPSGPRHVSQVVTVPTRGGAGRGEMEVLPAGSRGADASGLLARGSLTDLFQDIRGLDHQYVLVDAPPLLGVADTQVLAQYCDGIVVVARLDRLGVGTAVELRERLDRTVAEPLGLVVIGGQVTSSPYYVWEGVEAGAGAR